MNITITRRIDFCAGHRVCGHESKCQHLHGHNYTALVTVRRMIVETTNLRSEQRTFTDPLDHLGRVIDFSVVKTRVGGWIEKRWDHKFLMWTDDPLCQHLEAISPHSVVRTALNPTAENLGIMLRNVAADLLAPDGVEVIGIAIHETPNCYAEIT